MCKSVDESVDGRAGFEQICAIKMTRKPEQPVLPIRTHGGRRAGAGRKRTLPGPARVSHRLRGVADARWPLHVTVRVERGIRLQGLDMAEVLQQAFVAGCDKPGFRICQFSVQGNSLHLVCEASDDDALARGMQGWSIRFSRGVNRRLGRRGRVFCDRYHARALRTPAETRDALAQVFHNAHRDQQRLSPRFGGVDPYSSAWWFDGWENESWRAGARPDAERPVAKAKSWLLRVGWRKGGLLPRKPAKARQPRRG